MLPIGLGYEIGTSFDLETVDELYDLDWSFDISDLSDFSQQSDWDCPETNQFGTIQECITYWNALSDLAENEGRYAMLKKLNNDGYLSDTVKQFIFEIEGIWLFNEGV